jgi:hypothetical protein
MIGHNSKFVKDEDIEKAVEFFRTLAERVKDTIYQSRKAESLAERVLALLSLKANGKSMSERTAYAIQEQEYIDIQDKAFQAEAEEEALKAELKAAEAIRSIYQTQSANERS